ncbi:MAG: isoprenylcysteine carboxylmethyltransferase family protein [Nitrospirales bacterium]
MNVRKAIGGSSHSSLSVVLVGTQFVLIALIALTGPLWPANWSLRGILMIGGVIGVWSLQVIGMRNLHVFPEIPKNGRLVVQGPYRWVRHPMYTAVLLVTAAWVLGTPLPYRMGLWMGLLVTLLIKLLYEERLLLARFPTYKNYQIRTKRLIPFVW